MKDLEHLPLQSGLGVASDLSAPVASGWINLASGMEGCERIEAFFSGPAYQPHRHDTYAIGRTISGVQRFQYRGEGSAGVPGTVMVLYPDEVHDGQAGTEDGFHYQMIYLDPLLVQNALGHGYTLPFIPAGVTSNPQLLKAMEHVFAHMTEPLEPLQFDDAIYEIAKALKAAAPAGGRRKISLPDYRAADMARDYLRHSNGLVVSLEQLEALTGQHRWKLSRDFRTVFGTSPYRYLTLRRLDRAKAQIFEGLSLVQVALDAGFADQAHLTRHFRNAFGITPGQWRSITRMPA